MLTELEFKPSSWNVNDSKNKDLVSLTEILKSNSSLSIAINGYTDDSGIKEKNDTLSYKRAQAVMDHLIQRGIDSQRISFDGYGEQKPIADNRQKWGRDKNRRIEVVFK